jgi:hypothetical protein
MNKLVNKVLAVSLLMFGTIGTSQAAVIVHDTIAEFTTLTYSIPNGAFSGSIANNRQLLGNLFDNDTSTMLSLGNGGSLAAVINPTSNSIASGSIIELTNGNAHDESAIVFLGINGGGWINIGELFGNANNGGNSVVNNGSGYATLSVGPNASASVFTINVLSSGFNSIMIQDNTLSLKPDSASQDGFDIASFSVTSVSSPATLGLLGFGLVAIGFAARRRKA